MIVQCGGRGLRCLQTPSATGGCDRPHPKLYHAGGSSSRLRIVNSAVEVVTETERPQRPQEAPMPLTTNPITEQRILDLQSCFLSLLEEYEYEVKDEWVEGQIPEDLRGTFFRNGPGLQTSSDRYQRHTFDGDGMICSFTFKEGRVFFQNRYVRTSGFVKEQEAGKPLFRGPFTVGSPDGSPFFNPFNLTMKNSANTGVLYWGGELRAFWEGGKPYLLDPRSLETLGEDDIGGQLQTPMLAAHYRVVTEDDDSKRWICFSSNTNWGGTTLIFYEFDEAGRCLHTTSHQVPDCLITLLHDMVVTENYYAVVLGPMDFNLQKFMSQYFFSKCSIADCIQYNDQRPGRLVLVPRPGKSCAGTEARTFNVPPNFVFHNANAYELRDICGEGQQTPQGPPGPTQDSQPSRSTNEGCTSPSLDTNRADEDPHSSCAPRYVVLDCVAYDEISLAASQHTVSPHYYQGGSRPHLNRVVVDLLTDSVTTHQLARRTVEFPSVNWALHGRPHRYIYSACDCVDDELYWGPPQALVKFTTLPTAGVGAPIQEYVESETWVPGPRLFVNEPLFVARSSSPDIPDAQEEDDGYLLMTVQDAESGKGRLCIFDARRISEGPVATIHLPHYLPAALHGSFSYECLGPQGTTNLKNGVVSQIRPL